MSPKDNSFPESFDRLLPLEVKQMIFKLAASDNDSDIQISLLHDNEDRLDAPAVDLLAKLKHEYSADVYTQAVQYLTGPAFRWTFISDSQPHRFLLRAFRISVPAEVRKLIEHAYLPRVTVYGLTNSVTQSISLEDLLIMHRPGSTHYSDYLTRLGAASASAYSSTILFQIKRDIAGGISLLPLVLPSLNKLDLSLDIIDCSHTDILSLHGNATLSDQSQFQLINGPLIAGLGALGKSEAITGLAVRVIWKDFLKKDQSFRVEFTEDVEKVSQDSYIKALGLSAPVKSVVSHSDDSPV
jgi:hypothetical protein